MTAQEYIQSELRKLKRPQDLTKSSDKEELADVICRIIMSKKFRKYSVNAEYVKHIQQAIKLSIKNKEPIKVAFVFGGYKLWRLDESPEPDWAELFSMIYYANWLRSICEIYEPGVWFDFFSDDVIVPALNNIDPEDTKKYKESFESLLNFVKDYLPNNFSMTYNSVGDQYDSEDQFKKDLDNNLKSLKQSLGGKLPELTPELKATIELNVKLKPGQDDNANWHEEAQLLHDAFAQVSKRRPYYRMADKIMAITRPIPNSLAVGTTKSSVMKFWIGAGALLQKGDVFQPTILSPNQLSKAQVKWENISIEDLKGKNFQKIRIIK